MTNSEMIKQCECIDDVEECFEGGWLKRAKAYLADADKRSGS